MDSLRPQDGVLSLFDPLATPGTPPRNTGSPEDASDKENDAQPGPMTVFFNRIYKGVPSQKPTQTPKGKLIDFGERTPMPLKQEEVLAMGDFDGFADEVDVPSSPGMSRRPLAELELEHASHASRRSSTASEEQDAAPSTFKMVSTVPSESPFTNAMNSTNLSSRAVTEFDDPPPHTNAFSCPNISISLPEPEPLTEFAPRIHDADTSCGSSFVFLSPTAHTSTPAVQSPGAMRRSGTANSTSSIDPRRTSVDIQSSLNLLMQNGEMSFDLLNDKISFLNASTGSWTIVDADRDDDTFELARRDLRMDESAARYSRMPATNVEEDTLDLGKVQKRMESVLPRFEAIREESLDDIVVADIKPIPRMKELTPPKPVPSIERTLENVTTELARPPVFSLPPVAPLKVEAAPAADAESKPAESAKSLPAPRLVKKTWSSQHDRASSGASTTSTATAGSSTTAASRRSSISTSCPTSRASSISDQPRPTTNSAFKAPARRLSSASAAPPFAKPAAPAASKAPIRGVQRPPSASGMHAATAAPSKPAAAARALSSAKPAAAPKRVFEAPRPAASAKPEIGGPGSRLQRPTTVSTATARRGSVGASAKPPASGLKPPGASIASAPGVVAAPASAGAPRSGLPRPASRLPAPTKGAFGGVRRL
ncbi:hypothetical protein PsYK624_059910 [Phanerochaete sordida]|uniref:Uncharacterized protein n=1 Tax=Phanerochaete sordida TaxID=48140 RepID=A0A9P3G8Q4_9APHY|nr:hypothetical protein PsYK624_059910 [Phanerochaete sordida]